MSPAAWLATALCYAACWSLVAVTALGAAPPSVVASGVAAAFVPYAVMLRALGRTGRPSDAPARATAALATRRALYLALALGGVLLALPPVLSDDLYRYVWDGRVLAAGFDPYAHAPDASALAALRDEAWRHINHAELPTIYPPVAVAAFALLTPVGVLGPKLLGLLGLLLLVAAVSRLAPAARVSQAAFGTALNPLLLAEGPLHGHIDVLASACVALALVALPRGPVTGAPSALRRHLVRLDRHRAAQVWLFGALATGLKLVGLALVPVLLAARSGRLRWVGASLLVAGLLLMAPLTVSGHADRDSDSGLSHYARRWQGNDGAYALLERGFERALVARYGLRWGQLDLDPEPRWLQALERAGVDPRADLVGPKKEPPPRHLIQPVVLARLLARGTAALLALLVAASLFVFPTSPVHGLRRLVFAAFLLAPQLHPWYLALLVPLELVCGRVAGLGFAAAIYVAYAPLDAWARGRTWDVEPLGPALMHVFVVVLLALEAALAWRTRTETRLHER